MDYNHKEMILNPDRWPRGAILPMVRPNEKETFGKELGIIYNSDLNIVRLINMFGLPETAYELNRTPCIVYDSIDELLADGWTVD